METISGSAHHATGGNLVMLGGTMGVGKTATGRALQKLLPACAFLDGDWCWDMHPFVVNEATKALVLGNIAYMLNSFLKCGQFQNIVFCWVLHEPEIWRQVLGRLNTQGWRGYRLALGCSPASLCARLQKDIGAGLRAPDVVERSLARLPGYPGLGVPLLDTSCLTAAQAARQIARELAAG